MFLAVVTGGFVGYWAIPKFFQEPYIPLEAGTPKFSPDLPSEPQPLPQPAVLPPTLAPDPASISVARQSQDKGIILEVAALREEGDFLLLDVSLRNQGDRAVKFLYSFLELIDDRDQTLIPKVEGLPEDLPPNGRIYTGTVEIPRGLLVESQSVSLKLVDPDEQIKLEITEIPITSQTPPEVPIEPIEIEPTVIDPLATPAEE